MTSKSLWLRLSLIAVVCVGLLVVSREQILFALGQMLVYNEPPFHADAVLVLGGDYSGQRMLAGAQLVRDGWAPKVFVSGSGQQYGFHESTQAINYAVSSGYDRNTMVPLQYPAVSTVEEAQYDLVQLRRLGVRRYILVTSQSHTRRARGVFQRTAPDLEFRTVAAPESHWHRGRWWTDREGRKIWFFATTKAIADYFGI